jgi:hypothetical protein
MKFLFLIFPAAMLCFDGDAAVPPPRRNGSFLSWYASPPISRHTPVLQAGDSDDAISGMLNANMHVLLWRMFCMHVDSRA